MLKKEVKNTGTPLRKRLETPGNGENNVGEKPQRIGRPRLEESTTLTPEMERFAWDTARGFSPSEAAERLGITAEKASRYATTPIVLERVAVILGDKAHEWKSMQDELLTACYRQAISFVVQGKVPWANLQWLIDRLEGQKGMVQRGEDAAQGGGKAGGINKGGGKSMGGARAVPAQKGAEEGDDMMAGVSMFEQIPDEEEGEA